MAVPGIIAQGYFFDMIEGFDIYMWSFGSRSTVLLG